MATRLARLVFLDCKMAPKKSYHKQNEPNCLLHTMVTGIWVTKIQAYSLLQMFGSDACYFRVMSMLYIKKETKKYERKDISGMVHMASHFHNPGLPQSVEHLIYLNASVSNNLHRSYLTYVENTECCCFLETY